jgi:hypothetical protein
MRGGGSLTEVSKFSKKMLVTLATILPRARNAPAIPPAFRPADSREEATNTSST